MLNLFIPTTLVLVLLFMFVLKRLSLPLQHLKGPFLCRLWDKSTAMEWLQFCIKKDIKHNNKNSYKD